MVIFIFNMIMILWYCCLVLLQLPCW